MILLYKPYLSEKYMLEIYCNRNLIPINVKNDFKFIVLCALALV